MIFLRIGFIAILFLIFIFPVFPLPLQQPEDVAIIQAERKIVIDGNLDDWEGVREFPVNFTPEGGKKDPSADITVTARFTYDPKNFYAAIRAVDDIFEFPDRSWRYGDGLYLTFIDPYQGDQSDRFYTFGFSRQGKEVVKILVNMDGTYFPRVPIYDIEVKVIPDHANKSIIYEISIPFKYILPFKPFLKSKWGINVIYVDRDQNDREVLQLFPDRDYDTELTNKRRGVIFGIINHSPSTPEFQTLTNASHFYHDEDITVTTAANSSLDASGWKLRYDLSSASVYESDEKEVTLKKGMNFITFNLEKKEYPSGIYDLSVGILDENGSLRYSENSTFFILNRNEFEKEESGCLKIKEGELFSTDAVFRNSVPTLEIRFKWMKEFMEEAAPFADFSSLDRWSQELRFLFENVEQKKPALFLLGRVGRLGHRSKIDNTLQPYSVFVPDDYDGKKPVPLLVTLHGSGVDEEEAIFYVARVYLEARMRNRIGKMIILAPKARGLSDWYLGSSGEDVVECINHVKTLYKIDEKHIVIDGLSMGGYGAWRLGLLYPEMFRGVIVRSGAVSPPGYLNGENILDLLEKGKRRSFFIVHGDKEDAISVENAKKAVKRLKELRIDYEYHEVKGAANGEYDKWFEIFRWLRIILSQPIIQNEKGDSPSS